MNKMMETMKSMSREERAEYFKAHKSELMDSALEKASGGTAGKEVENPNSEVTLYEGNWITSFGYVCNGEVEC